MYYYHLTKNQKKIVLILLQDADAYIQARKRLESYSLITNKKYSKPLMSYTGKCLINKSCMTMVWDGGDVKHYELTAQARTEFKEYLNESSSLSLTSEVHISQYTDY